MLDTSAITPSTRRHTLWLGLHADIGAATLAGLIAGAVFLGVDLLISAVVDARLSFGPAYITLHGLAGAEAVAGQVNTGMMLAAIFVHFVLSIVLAFPLAGVIHPWKDRAAAGGFGLVLGVALYTINFHLFAVGMPLLEAGRDVSMIAGYAIFGLVLALAYMRLSRRTHKKAI